MSKASGSHNGQVRRRREIPLHRLQHVHPPQGQLQHKETEEEEEQGRPHPRHPPGPLRSRDGRREKGGGGGGGGAVHMP
ncbi:unnamed protein product [Closterium sp. NIES-64]|nr:unnamed protein product [Closterium sp. NIES-64]